MKTTRQILEHKQSDRTSKRIRHYAVFIIATLTLTLVGVCVLIAFSLTQTSKKEGLDYANQLKLWLMRMDTTTTVTEKRKAK